MNVILINESAGKSWIRTRRVLSRYLPQIGSRTWAGQISADGLASLREHLKDVASKTAAVACHHIITRSRTELAWIVGSSACFNEDGRYAFRHTAAKPEVVLRPEKSPAEAFAVAITRLAALFHDIGKASVAFQAKLFKGTGSETVRHDLLSFLVLAESLWTPGVTDATWLERLVDSPRAACACVTPSAMLPASSPWLALITARLDAEKGILVGKEDLAALGEHAPGLLSVLWLVLTHHRLPEGDILGEQIDAGGHLNKAGALRTPAPLDQCLLPHAGAKPWDDATWQANVKSAALAAQAALDNMTAAGFSAPSSFFWPQLCAHLLRPSLILSDHIGSMQAEKGATLKKAFLGPGADMYANRVGDRHAGDTLTTHLRKVARLSRQLTSFTLAPVGMPTTSLPAHSLALNTGLPPGFKWQEELGNACATAQASGPVFASIIAETGAGKSLAAVRAMHNLSPAGMRFTLALGLRSLTVQSAESMLADAEMDARHLTVAVGQPHTLGLAQAARDNQEEDSTSTRLGSESAGGGALEAVLSNTAYDASWLRGICTEKEAESYWSKPALSFLSMPVVACTVDHLVSAVSLLRGGDAKLFLRCASSDLVLDEIDAYSPSDLQTIGKLAFVTGLHGRHLVLMSATLNPAVREGLFAAWHHGLTMHCALKGTPLHFGTVYASNVLRPMVLETPAPAAAAIAWSQFVTDVCAASKAQSVCRRIMAVQPLVATTLEDAFADIERAACTLHTSHHTVDSLSGKRVSVGFVRFNTAKNAWKMSQYLATRAVNNNNGPDVRFVAYHSKFPRSYLGVLDATLGQLTRRKDAEGFLQTPALRTAIESSTSQDVVVIVCTTTLIETGRDFDFDWAILEPRSVRGEVQAVGRVRRHRYQALAGTAPNVLLLSRPLKALTLLRGQATANRAFWSQPGVEDSLPNLRVQEFLPEIVKALMPLAMPASLATGAPAASLAYSAPRRVPGASRRPMAVTFDASLTSNTLPLPLWAASMDAQVCLTAVPDYASNRIGFLEQQVPAINLLADGAACIGRGVPASLHWYLHSYGALNANHARSTRFRGVEACSALFIPGNTEVRFVDEVTGLRQLCLQAEFTHVSGACALITDLAAQAEKLSTGDKHIDGAALRCERGAASVKALTWDPLLGFRE